VSWRRVACPGAITVAVLLGALAPVEPIRDAVTRAPVSGAHLVRPLSYTLLAPLSDTLDAFSLLSVPQLIAFGVSLIAVYIAFRLVLRSAHGASAWCEFCYALRAFLLLALFVILAAVLPRPMAALRMDDRDAVVFDIHSHTNYSHDARATFTVAENRAWHRAAGFDVAFITDHSCFDGAAEGLRTNPRTAGDGTVLLSGIELPPDQKHLLLLEPPTAPMPHGALEAWCQRIGDGVFSPVLPVIIETIPEQLSWLSDLAPGHTPGLNGIEISDGAPRGIAQAQRDRAFILVQSERLGLVPLAGSNNHGWGRTAVAWNVATLPGWREMRPDSLDAALKAKLRDGGRAAARVIERRSPDAYGVPGLWLTLPAMLFDIARTISIPERLSWIAWSWILWAVIPLIPRTRWSARAA